MTDPTTRMTVVEGDITRQDVDAVVNAANAELGPGGGVAGAIQRVAGPDLLAACRPLGGCATGDAKATPGFRLPARWVIHTVGPVWHGGGDDEDALLAACYRRSLEVAQEIGARTVAFPAISTGIFGFPPQRAAPIAVDAVAEALGRLEGIEGVRFVCFGAESAALHRAALERLAAG
ncbi:O-acetyl-ADP-ribose deacetylase [Caenispirillum bisanense]|uniref:O-acetyl-ADP-ribose deacetylase (Regulator of RNase III), contains Macro domain n=1 Tax=Caenispirillum bisanense TaxID=414052 RepID=A0A286G9L0_9PROT|nr:O-acetyl-ADP-ribose deacetylase [Caenispirillum bisanense]SOD92243.1 O-acetyl-ADP-ribose deacetylase (regulator of RNase III), contains Macro domain [Caenispirillum bisanense]